MSDDLLFAPLLSGLAIVFAIEGYFQRPINNFLAAFFSILRRRQQRLEEAEMQYISELLGDSNFFIMETIRVFAQGIIFFLLFSILLIFPTGQKGMLFDLIARLIGIMSIWVGHHATSNLSLINQARELYREDLQINSEIGSDFDETAYISESPANVERLRAAIKQYEMGQHNSIPLKSGLTH